MYELISPTLKSFGGSQLSVAVVSLEAITVGIKGGPGACSIEENSLEVETLFAVMLTYAMDDVSPRKDLARQL